MFINNPTTTNYTVNTLRTKEQIVEALLKEEKITFKEALTLMQPDVQVQDLNKPASIPPYNPNGPFWGGFTYTGETELSKTYDPKTARADGHSY